MNKTDTNVKKRETWGSQFGLIMSMAGMAIGLGNVWRFPYMVGEYGGGAFVLAYLICVVLVVLPLCIVEVGIGKGMGKGLIDTYVAVFKGSKIAGIIVGGGCALIYFAMNFYFLPILANTAQFLFGSATSAWNRIPPDQIYNTYYDNKAAMVVITTILILAVGFIVYKGVNKGIELVSKWMVPLIFVFFIITIVMTAVVVPNIGAGFDYFLNPDFSKLKSFDIWVGAMGQALFSVGVGPGCMLVYGSHMKRKSDVTLSITTINFLDSSVGLLAGMVIIPACIALGLNPESGSNLIFVVLPSVFARIPFGNVIGIMVFLAIFFAGITSAVAQLEVAVTTFEDYFGWSRFKVSGVMTAATLIICTMGIFKESVLQFWTDFSGNYGFIVTAGIGAICFSWVYGVKKIRENSVNPNSLYKLGSWFDPFVKFVAVPIMVIIMINSLFPFL